MHMVVIGDPQPKFELGQTVATPKALSEIPSDEIARPLSALPGRLGKIGCGRC